MFSRFKLIGLIAAVVMFGSVFAHAQTEAAKDNADKKQEKPKKDEKKDEKPKKQQAFDIKNATADQIAETLMFIYGGFGGRASLGQIRRTTVENGKTTFINTDGTSEQISYTRRIVRGADSLKEKMRMDQEFPNARYSYIFNDGKTFGLFNETVFTPRDENVKAFESYYNHGLETLLRYKENGSTVAIGNREKVLGVDYILLDVTDKQSRVTRFFISEKTLKVMALEYTEDGIKYKRKFYDYRNAQGTLVPYRTTLSAGDKLIEETTVSTITFGQKIEDDVFKS